MRAPRSSSQQLSLFGGDAPAFATRVEERPLRLDSLPGIESDRALAARLPPEVHFGTSTWTYPGWVGVIYPGRPSERWLIDEGLRTYASHPLLRTLGMDRAYYNPLKDDELRRFAAQLPDGFRCSMKAWGALTSRVEPMSRAPNPRYLDPTLFCDRVLSPLARSFADHIGPIVLEFPPIPSSSLPSSSQFVDELHRFLAQIPREFSYAVELRNRELLTPEYLRLLNHHGVAHVLNLWERMPTIGEQLGMPGILTAPFVVSRLMLRPGTRYEQMKRAYAPFDRIHHVDETMRNDISELAHACVRSARPLYVIAGNKVEGCSPLSIRGIAERIVQGRERAPFEPRKSLAVLENERALQG